MQNVFSSNFYFRWFFVFWFRRKILHLCTFKPAKNSIRTADLYSSWFVTDNDLNPSTKGADLNLHRFKTPTCRRFMSAKVGSLCAFKMRKGVYSHIIIIIIFWIFFENENIISIVSMTVVLALTVHGLQ
jgi:hypothetical protein